MEKNTINIPPRHPGNRKPPEEPRGTIYAAENGKPIRYAGAPPRRNQMCPCGSGRKFKHCHWNGNSWQKPMGGAEG